MASSRDSRATACLTGGHCYGTGHGQLSSCSAVMPSARRKLAVGVGPVTDGLDGENGVASGDAKGKGRAVSSVTASA